MQYFRWVLLCWFYLPIAAPPVPQAAAENWPGWRGPRGDGTSLEHHAPRAWNAPQGKNVIWRSPLEGNGHSSPVVWQQRVFLTTCLPETGARVLQCFETMEGNRLWERTVITAPLEAKHDLNSFASGTPATDGEQIYVTFLEPRSDVSRTEERSATPGKLVVAAYDFDGRQRWLARPGDFASIHGFCSSPVLFEQLVIVNGDHDGDSYLVALNRDSGETVWKVPRRHRTRSYVTPLIREAAGRTQMVLSGSQEVVSLDPRTGETHWFVEGPTEQFVASMVFDGERFFLNAGFPTHHVMAIRPDGSGNVSDSHVLWHSTDAKSYVPSPVVIDGYLLVADDRGTVNCFDAKTGDRLWRERLGTHYSASLITAEGLVYLTADDGKTKVVRPGPKLEVVAENELGEWTFASPALAGQRLYLRGDKHLYCLGEAEEQRARLSP